jgi:hypothetical protein
VALKNCSKKKKRGTQAVGPDKEKRGLHQFSMKGEAIPLSMLYFYMTVIFGKLR